MNTRKTILTSLAVFVALTIACAQTKQPVTWQFSAVKSGGNETELQVYARIDSAWHICPQLIQGNGPFPIAFITDPSPEYELVGQNKLQGRVTQIKPCHNRLTAGYERTMLLIQKIIVNKTGTIKGKLSYIACRGEECLPETLSFSIAVKSLK